MVVVELGMAVEIARLFEEGGGDGLLGGCDLDDGGLLIVVLRA